MACECPLCSARTEIADLKNKLGDARKLAEAVLGAMNENELERWNGDLSMAISRWLGTQTGRAGKRSHSEFHPIKDWFRLIPNETAKQFAQWLLRLAAEDLERAAVEERDGLPELAPASRPT